MKKLKIFILLGLLVFFGFALSSEVHAQDDGPKILEIGDVLPAGEIKLSWDFTERDLPIDDTIITIRDANDALFIRIDLSEEFVFRIFTLGNRFYNLSDEVIITLERDWIITSIPYGADAYYEYIDGFIFWEVVPSGYSITFEENGGSQVTDLSEQTALPNPLPTPTKSGYTFVNWYYDSAFTQIANPGDTIESNVTLYAKWELNTYTITYNSNGGSSISQTSDATQLPNPLPIPTKENYIFHGWYYNSDFTNRAYPGDPLTSDITLYAKWGLTDSPKIFEIGDVLPAGEIKISWDFTGYPVASDDTFYIKGTDGIDNYFIGIDEFGNIYLTIFGVDLGAVDLIGNLIITLDNEVTITEFGSVGKDYYEYIDGALFWEVVTSEDPYIIHDDLYNLYNGEELDLELGYTLPAAKIAINLVYNNTGGQGSGMIVYTFGTYGRIALTAFEDMNPSVTETWAMINVIMLDDDWKMNILHDSLASQEFGTTRGILSVGMIIDLTDASEEERTITEISIIGETAIDGIFSRILSIDESIYLEGYSEGREIYGYYDSTTDEWLSVSEYLNRYGTDKPGQSDFYNNFDKYFIPAMIIVFGGAIVLTILKVFKGRE